MLGYVLIAPAASDKPSQKSQHRFGVSFGNDGLLSLVKSCTPPALGGADETSEARGGRQRVGDRGHQAGGNNIPITHWAEGVSEPSQLPRGPTVMLSRQHSLQSQRCG